MSEIEKYLKANREKLDNRKPSAELWENIAARLEEKPVRRMFGSYLKWPVAACMILLTGIGIFYFLHEDKKLPGNNIAKTNDIKPGGQRKVTTVGQLNNTGDQDVKPGSRAGKNVKLLADLPSGDKKSKRKPASSLPEADGELFLQFESELLAVVEKERMEVLGTPIIGESPEFLNSFINENKVLIADKNKIKEEIKKDGLTNVTVEQLIKNYEYRIRLLKQLRMEMQKVNNANKHGKKQEKKYIKHI